MRKNIKYALFFIGGVAVGIGVCGANLISYAIDDEDIRKALKNKISRKIDKALYGDEPNRKRHSRYSFSIDDVIFESRKEAMDALDDMKNILDTYGFVTVTDMYDTVGIPVSYMNSKYGWTSLNNAEVVRIRMGYKINLPQPVYIDYGGINAG